MRILAAAFAVAAGLLALPAAHASAGKVRYTPSCALSEDAAGNLVVTVTGAAPATDYSFYLYATVPDGSLPQVENGGFTADAAGGLIFGIGLVADLTGAYPGTTGLVFDLIPQNFYPQHGNRDHVLASCTFPPS
jgi:hypothetical protein